jgi:hypothetical protein
MVAAAPPAPPGHEPVERAEPWRSAAISHGGAHPLEWLRGFALSVERLAAQGVASGALRGAADELRAGLPDDVSARVRTLLESGLTTLEHAVAAAAETSSTPGSWSQATAEAVVRGTVEEFRRLIPELRPTTREVLERVKTWLERSASEAAARAQEIRAPGDRARIAAAGAISGALEKLSEELPRLAQPAADLAEQVGRALVRGSADELSQRMQRVGRSPLFRMAIAGGAVLVVLFAARRR